MVDRPAPLLNFPLPNFQFGYQPQENNFIQPPQIQQDENKDKRPTPANSGNKKRKPEQSQSHQEKEPKNPVHLNHNFDEFIQATSPQSQLVENEDKIPIPGDSENKKKKPSPQSQQDANNTTKPNEEKIDKKEKETKKPNHIDQKINESIKTTIPPKSTLNLNKTKSSPDNIIFPDEDDETISLSPIEILSTTPAVYSTTHKRIIPGLPSPDDDGDYNEDDKISNSALLSLVG